MKLNFKLILFPFLYIFLVQNLYAQDDNPEIQEFTVLNFSVKKPYTLKEEAGITLEFDLKMSNPLEKYYDYPYRIYAKLTDSNSKQVYLSFESKEVQAKESIKNKKIAEVKNLIVYIPYSKIDVPPGKHNLKISIIAESDYKEFGEIFSKNLLVNKPQIFVYEKQKFKISNFKINPNGIKHSLTGIDILFNCNFKFKASQIHNIHLDDEKGAYYFHIELIDKKTNQIIKFFKESSNTLRTIPYKRNNNLNIHIPFNAINLPEGIYELTANLTVSDKNEIIRFEGLKEEDLKIKQPKLYWANVNLTELEASFKKYDLSNVFGRIFSRPSSNKGKGYPDTYWQVSTGEVSTFRSSQNKNDFTVFPGSCDFVITDKDPVSLSAWDHDVLNPSDLIGKFNLKHKFGNDKKSFKSISFQGVKTASFSFNKTKLPHLINKSIVIKNIKKEGVSGISVLLDYETSELPGDNKIAITPIFKTASEVIPIKEYKNTETDSDNINLQNPKGEVNIFIPFYSIKKDYIPGFEMKLNEFDYLIGNCFSNQTVKFPELNDTKIKIKNTKDYYNETSGFQGMAIEITYTIPEYYKQEGKVSSYIKISDNNYKHITDTTINAEYYTNKPFTYFIPFFKLKNLSGNNVFKITEKTSFDSKIRIGRNDTNFNFTIPVLLKIRIYGCEIKFNESENNKKTFFEISQGNRKIYSSDSKLKNSKVLWENQNIDLTCHPNDKITITTYEKDNSGIASEINKNSFKAKKLQESDKLKIKGEKYSFKKITLIIEK